MIEFILGILLLILIGAGMIESYMLQITLSQLPIRIHVNGSRGKSSVTRLIAAGLRSGGLKTLAKTTGTSPRIIDQNGKDRIIHRLRSASIGEQVRLLRNLSKENPDAIVIECMAVNPQYQWISEQKMVKSTTSVITNVRPDHLDEMGSTLEENAMSLSNTIPFNGYLVTSEQKMSYVFSKIADKRKTKYIPVDTESISDMFMRKFNYLEHIDNVALALKVCEIYGVDKDIALKGMLKAQPDPGATLIWKIKNENLINYFVNLMAANDPESTYQAYKNLRSRIKETRICIFFNTRKDRRYRTNQLLSLIYNKIQPDTLIIRGENFPDKFQEYKENYPSMNVHELSYNANSQDVINSFFNLSGYYIIGVGNMVGWGEQFVSDLKEYKYDR